MKPVKILTGISLRRWQVETINKWNETTHTILTASRQIGKSALGVIILLDFMFRCDKNRNIMALVAMPTMQQTMQMYFKRLNRWLENLPVTLLTIQKSQDRCVITLKRPWLNDTYAFVEFIGCGSKDSIRGRDLDLLLIDEAAFITADIINKILLPMVDDTQGKVYITSTVNGRNHYQEMKEAWAQDYEEGHRDVSEVSFDITQCRLRPLEFIETKERLAKRSKQYHTFRQEYWLDPDAAASGIAPFANKVAKIRSKHATVPCTLNLSEGDSFIYDQVFVSVDMGKPNNNPAWIWTHASSGRKHIFGYVDHLNQYELLDYLAKFPSFVPDSYRTKINVIYPDDVKQPSVMEGASRFMLLEQYIKDKGYGNKIKIHVLPRTKCRKALFYDAISFFDKCIFDLREVSVGLDKLSGARFKADAKTGAIKFGDFVSNGNQHACDALAYAAAADINGMARKQSFGGLDSPLMHRPTIRNNKRLRSA